MFYVGQKVVCVDAERTNPYEKAELTEGVVYTISSLVGEISRFAAPFSLPQHARGLGFNLQEVPGRGVPFAAIRFRPVVERKTDISVLTALLKPNPAKVQELWGVE